MRRLEGFVLLALTAAVLSGCATMTVGSYVGRTVDLTTYRTYDWGPPDALPIGDARLDNHTVFQDHLQGAVEKALAARGYARVGSEAPDILIHYHATVARRIDVDSLNPGYDCRGSGCEPRVFAYDAGTLVIDIVDAKTKRLLWRGWAQDSMDGVLEDQDEMEAQIAEAVTRIFERLPGRL